MALYDQYISRAGAAALIPESVSREIIQSVPEQSAVMRFGRRLPNMTSAQLRMPVLSGLITAGFVDGDTGLKPTSQVAWENKYINAAELACIVPIPEKVLDDVAYDVWTEIRPRIVEAMGKAFDMAVLYGTNATSTAGDVTGYHTEVILKKRETELIEGGDVAGTTKASQLFVATEGQTDFTVTDFTATPYYLALIDYVPQSDGVVTRSGQVFTYAGGLTEGQTLLIVRI